MPGNDQSQPPREGLEQLHSTRQWDRLLEFAQRSLVADPTHVPTRQHIAWAYAKTDRFAAMEPHVEFLLREHSGDVENHQLAAIYFLETGKHLRAKTHVCFLLRSDPKKPNFHFLASLLALRMGRLQAARIHIRKTRELAPDWADAAHLEIEIDSRDRREVRHAWDRIRRLEETLPMDPHNTRIIANIGTIYLDELDEPRKAEEYFRRALALDPQDRAAQFSLLRTILARSLLYRTLIFPTNLLRSCSPSRDDFLISAILLVWGGSVGAYFTPAAWLFERMVLHEYAIVRPAYTAPLSLVQKWPLWLRLFFSFALVSGLAFVLLWQVFALPASTALHILGWVFAVHFAWVSGVAAHAEFQSYRARRRLASRPVESVRSSAFVLDRDHTSARA